MLQPCTLFFIPVQPTQGLALHFEYVKLFSLPPTRLLRAKKAASILVTVQLFVETYIFISTNHFKIYTVIVTDFLIDSF